MEIEFKYNINESDLIKFVNNTIKYAKIHKIKKILAVISTFFLGLVIPSVISPIDRSLIEMIMFGILVSVIMYPVYLIMVKYFEKRRILLNKHLFLGTHLCSISDQGFSTVRLNNHKTDVNARNYQRKHNIKNLYKWNEILYFCKDNKTVFVYLKKNHVSIIKPNSHTEDVELFFKEKSILKRG